MSKTLRKGLPARHRAQAGYIGIFDSGFGGLHVLSGIQKKLPQYNYIYLGDTARMPYGERSQKEIYRFTKEALDFLFEQGCEFVVFACHTASSKALRIIQTRYIPEVYPDKKVLGVLVPVSEEAVSVTKNNRIGVIATEATVASKKFVRELTKLNPHVSVFQNACPLLVRFVEEGTHDSEEAERVLRAYLVPLLRKNIDTLVLGCTHYGILKPKIRSIVGNRIRIIHSASVVPQKLAAYLKHHPEIETKLKKAEAVTFYSTDRTPRFKKLGSIFFGKPIKTKKAVLKSDFNLN